MSFAEGRLQVSHKFEHTFSDVNFGRGTRLGPAHAAMPGPPGGSERPRQRHRLRPSRGRLSASGRRAQCPIGVMSRICLALGRITVCRFLCLRGRGCVYAETCVYARAYVYAPDAAFTQGRDERQVAPPPPGPPRAGPRGPPAALKCQNGKRRPWSKRSSSVVNGSER